MLVTISLRSFNTMKKKNIKKLIYKNIYLHDKEQKTRN